MNDDDDDDDDDNDKDDISILEGPLATKSLKYNIYYHQLYQTLITISPKPLLNNKKLKLLMSIKSFDVFVIFLFCHVIYIIIIIVMI